MSKEIEVALLIMVVVLFAAPFFGLIIEWSMILVLLGVGLWSGYCIVNWWFTSLKSRYSQCKLQFRK